jgi:hypothetical protein
MGGVMAIVDDKTVSKIEMRALSSCEQARAVYIQNDQDATAAMKLLCEVVNPLIKEGDELFDPMIAAAYNSHQVAIATKKKAVGGLTAAKLHLRNELGRWAQFVEDREREIRLRLEQEARDKEAQRLEREIVAIEAAGEEDAAEQIQAVLEAPRPALVLPPATVTVAVPGARDVYEAEVINEREFYRAIGDGRIPVTFAQPKQGALNAMARAMQEGFNLPGCRLLKSKDVRSSRGTH